MRSLFVFAGIIAIAFAASGEVSLGFQSGVNLTNAEADFSFRYTSSEIHDLVLTELFIWKSVSIDASAANATAKAAANIMLGLGGVPTSLNPPFAILAYGSGEAAVDVSIKSFVNNLFDSIGAKIDANFAGGVVAMGAFGMQEYDPDDKPVGKYFSFTHGCSSTDLIEGDNGNLKGLTCVIAPSGTGAKVTATFVTSKRAGVLEYGNTPVSPRSYEMVIEVTGFPLSDKKNHVRMDIGLLTASGAGNVEGTANVVHREGKDDLYAVASSYAVIGGERKKLKVKIESGDTGLNGLVETALEAALGGTIDAQIARVDFPAGATDFVYDPAVGAGCNVYDAGASTIALSLLVAILCVLVYLF